MENENKTESKQDEVSKDKSKLNKPDEDNIDHLSRSNEDNFHHFHCEMAVDNFEAGEFDAALFYIEKSLIYAQGYPSSGKDKLNALGHKGACLNELMRFEEAALVYQQTFDHLKSIKGQFDNEENDYQCQLGHCLYELGMVNSSLKKNEEALRNFDDALTALPFNNQQSQYPNEEMISSIWNEQALIYCDQKNFAAAKLKYQQLLEITTKNNDIRCQAISYNNICNLKIQSNEFDEEALQFINKAIQLYTEQHDGQKNKDVLMSLFNKCMILCVIESKENQNKQQQQSQLSQQQYNDQTYEGTLKLLFQEAIKVQGGGQINKKFADCIARQGEVCISQLFKLAMTNVAFKNHAIRLFKEAHSVYNSLNDNEDEMEMKEQIKLLEDCFEV